MHVPYPRAVPLPYTPPRTCETPKLTSTVSRRNDMAQICVSQGFAMPRAIARKRPDLTYSARPSAGPALRTGRRIPHLGAPSATPSQPNKSGRSVHACTSDLSQAWGIVAESWPVSGLTHAQSQGNHHHKSCPSRASPLLVRTASPILNGSDTICAGGCSQVSAKSDIFWTPGVTSATASRNFTSPPGRRHYGHTSTERHKPALHLSLRNSCLQNQTHKVRGDEATQAPPTPTTPPRTESHMRLATACGAMDTTLSFRDVTRTRVPTLCRNRKCK